MQAMMINLMNRRRCRLLRILFLLQLILTGLQQAVAVPIRPRIRSCRRLQRNTGWWNLVWTVYSEKRFKKTFRMTRQTFSLIHDRIKDDLTKESVTEELLALTHALLELISSLDKAELVFLSPSLATFLHLFDYLKM